MRDATQTFFGLADPAFARPPKTPYLDQTRQKALQQLRHLVDRRGFGVLTAPPGCGKTVLLHYLCNDLSDNHHQVIYVPFSFLEKGQLLQFLAAAMGLQEKRGMAANLRIIQQHLHHSQPLNTVIVVDEVEHLEIATTHILRLLVHDRPDTTFHCTLILAGADTFVDHQLRLHINEPLRQRITLYIRLQPLDQLHAQRYLAHYLAQAGAGELFDSPALQLIYELSNGVPRIINTLAEAAMNIAAERQQRSVDLDHVQEAADAVMPPQIAQVLS